MRAPMKVVKRDGSIVEYDRSKIITAIQKANAEVSEEEQLELLASDGMLVKRPPGPDRGHCPAH